MTTEETRERSPRNSTDIPNRRQYKCYAIGVAYSGEGYFGFQFQPGDTPTVENDIQKALIAGGFIDASLVENEKSRQLLYWSRAARTDRGVHAAMNIVSCRLDSTKIPTKPNAAEGGSELDQEKFVSALNGLLPAGIRALFVNRVIMRFDARIHCDRRRYEYYLPAHIAGKPLDLERLNTELQKYVGTHNFHNFTKGMKANDKASFRHIPSVRVAYFGEDKETLVVSLVGQSFLLNQIRKMVSLAVEVTLGLAPADAIERALSSPDLVHVHMVPGEGLLLDHLFYKAYDTHKCGDYTVTTPFSWLIGDEHGEGGDEFVLGRISEFKRKLVTTQILPVLKPLIDAWLTEVVIPNDWETRHLPRDPPPAGITDQQSPAAEESNP